MNKKSLAMRINNVADRLHRLAMKMMEDAGDIEIKYLSCQGSTCPVCDSEDIEGHIVEVSCGYAHQEVSCNFCDSDWSDIYDLVGMELDYVPDSMKQEVGL